MTFTPNIILVLLFCVTNTWGHSQVDFESNNLKASDHGVKFENNVRDTEKVRIQVYYECLCGGCKDFDINQLGPVIDTMSRHLDIKTYPFGNARIIDNNGKPEVRCQHGPPECYGNKLHACALDQLEHTTALMYNICLMKTGDPNGSDDAAADKCGKSMDINSGPIKQCANGARGEELLLYYGKESEKAQLPYVPYVLINGKLFEGDDFKDAVCKAFITPPPSCE